ncbi:uncharacterized protein LOC120592596 [Pteropus medius]|uniref:uncharacterized protein LOC120592596 n=1 Tax=Pteropus vampyrus TaxID=132908 RepID=UPI00196AF6E6|nr:uncharacterized protein LOC120592596 [Pteropus giganteus]
MATFDPFSFGEQKGDRWSCGVGALPRPGPFPAPRALLLVRGALLRRRVVQAHVLLAGSPADHPDARSHGLGQVVASQLPLGGGLGGFTGLREVLRKRGQRQSAQQTGSKEMAWGQRSFVGLDFLDLGQRHFIDTAPVPNAKSWSTTPSRNPEALTSGCTSSPGLSHPCWRAGERICRTPELQPRRGPHRLGAGEQCLDTEVGAASASLKLNLWTGARVLGCPALGPEHREEWLG